MGRKNHVRRRHTALDSTVFREEKLLGHAGKLSHEERRGASFALLLCCGPKSSIGLINGMALTLKAWQQQIGKRVRELRAGKSLAQDRFAEVSGLHRTFIGRVERGEANVTLETLLRLSASLGCELDDLFRTPDSAIRSASNVPSSSLTDVLANIKEPRRWIDPDSLIRLMVENPSLRGFTYGYVSEYQFSLHLLSLGEHISHHYKEDDHKKTKSDRTFVYCGKSYTVQLKSLQTNSIKETAHGVFRATLQNDASDRRKVTLPNGHKLETTCYVVGEYDILGVSLQPFCGDWKFAFKKNKNLARTRNRKYLSEDQEYLLSTTESITFPLDDSWTQDVLSLLDDSDLGEVRVVSATRDQEQVAVETPNQGGEVLIEQSRVYELPLDYGEPKPDSH